EDGADVAPASLGSSVRLDDVESRGVEHLDQSACGPAVRANDGMIERLDLGAVEVAEQHSAAGPQYARELEQRDADPRRLVMNRREPGKDAAEGVVGDGDDPEVLVDVHPVPVADVSDERFGRLPDDAVRPLLREKLLVTELVAGVVDPLSLDLRDRLPGGLDPDPEHLSGGGVREFVEVQFDRCARCRFSADLRGHHDVPASPERSTDDRISEVSRWLSCRDLDYATPRPCASLGEVPPCAGAVERRRLTDNDHGVGPVAVSRDGVVEGQDDGLDAGGQITEARRACGCGSKTSDPAERTRPGEAAEGVLRYLWEVFEVTAERGERLAEPLSPVSPTSRRPFSVRSDSLRASCSASSSRETSRAPSRPTSEAARSRSLNASSAFSSGLMMPLRTPSSNPRVSAAMPISWTEAIIVLSVRGALGADGRAGEAGADGVDAVADEGAEFGGQLALAGAVAVGGEERVALVGVGDREPAYDAGVAHGELHAAAEGVEPVVFVVQCDDRRVAGESDGGSAEHDRFGAGEVRAGELAEREQQPFDLAGPCDAGEQARF
ncbi:hypothetical protein FF38_01807, partial [Lucilia cuprina]